MGMAKQAVLVVGVAALASCAGMGSLPGELTETLARGAPGSARIVVRGTAIAEVSAPIAASDLPAPVAVAVASTQPGGTAVEVARVFGEGGTAFRVTVEYPEGVAGRRRSVLVDPTGRVLERSHRVPAAEVEPAVRRAVATRDRGRLETAEVVQGEPGVEFYRFVLEREDGVRTAVECALDGSGQRTARLLPAELQVWR